MRVFVSQRRVWLAGLVVGLSLGAGARGDATPEHTDAIALVAGTALDIDLAGRDAVAMALPTGVGRAVLRVQEQFASLELDVPEGDGTTTLRSTGDAPLVWLYESGDQSPTVTLRVLDRSARVPAAIVSVQEPPAAHLGVLALETAMSRMPRNPTDDELRRFAALAERAAALWRSLEEESSAVRSLLMAASMYASANEPETARRLAAEALPHAERLSDRMSVGIAQNGIGLASIHLEDFVRARDALEQAREALAEYYGDMAVNPAQSNLCFLAFETRKYATAETCYLRLKAKAEATGNPRAADRYENTLAGVYWNRGNTYKASEILRRLVDQPIASARQRARRLNNLGVSLRALGRPQEALNAYQQALELARETGSRQLTLQTLNNMAVVYGDLGAPHQAVELLAEVYEKRDRREDRVWSRRARNYGAALLAVGDLDSASTILEDAIELALRIEDAAGAVESRRLAASAAMARGENTLAVSHAAAAVEGAVALGDASRQQALAYSMLGRAQRAAGDHAAAVKNLTRALKLWESIGNPYGAVFSRTALGWAYRGLGEFERATALARESVVDIEALRTDIASQDLRATYQSYVSQAFELAVQSLIDAGDGVGALEMSERFRAKTLIDALSQGASQRSDDVPAALAEQRDDAIAAINRASDDQLRGRETKSIATLLAELDVINDRIAAATGATSTTTEAVDAQQIRALHAPGDLTLAYLFTESSGYLWCIDTDGVDVIVLDDIASIDGHARALHNALSRQGSYVDAATALGQHVLAPVAERIAAASRVSIIADGALHYVPFDVLTTDASPEPVLLTKPTTYLPSLTALALTRNLPPAKGRGVAVLADPVFNAGDDRVPDRGTMRGGANLNRLQMTRAEAETIAEQAEDIEVHLHLGLAASPAQLRSDDVTSANILHIATHGFADDEIPARSGIALSMVDAGGNPVTGYVGLRDIYGLDLDADLVVLSACETALGQDLAGEGLLGLTRGFMNAGARRVVASLWQVQDRATAKLMGAFYRELFAGAAPAEALLSAKTSLRRDRRYRHPYFWSGFTLQGDWRAWQVR